MISKDSLDLRTLDFAREEQTRELLNKGINTQDIISLGKSWYINRFQETKDDCLPFYVKRVKFRDLGKCCRNILSIIPKNSNPKKKLEWMLRRSKIEQRAAGQNKDNNYRGTFRDFSYVGDAYRDLTDFFLNIDDLEHAQKFSKEASLFYNISVRYADKTLENMNLDEIDRYKITKHLLNTMAMLAVLDLDIYDKDTKQSRMYNVRHNVFKIDKMKYYLKQYKLPINCLYSKARVMLHNGIDTLNQRQRQELYETLTQVKLGFESYKSMNSKIRERYTHVVEGLDKLEKTMFKNN